MRILEYLRAYVTDWFSGMSGGMSVILTFWTILWAPENPGLRTGLWLASALCFIASSYRVWSKERSKVERLRKQTDFEVNQIVKEFDEIRANILLSTLENKISDQLKQLKAFIHRNPNLLHADGIRDFYDRFIQPKEIHLEFGAELDLTQADYVQLKEQLLLMDVSSAIREMR